jgi:general secretion pathway protein G
MVTTMGLRRTRRGFTLIELLVVMVIIALLLTIAVPRYFNSVDHARQAVLRENLFLMRDALDKHYADTGRYPETLAELVDKKYLRRLPVDPLTQSESTWIVLPPEAPDQGAVFDVRSGAPGQSAAGIPFSEL